MNHILYEKFKILIIKKESFMNTLSPCLKCQSVYVYQDGHLLICPECGYEFSPDTVLGDTDETQVIYDAYGTVLNDGDSVTIIKDLKIKGSSNVVKVGTKIKNIRLTTGDHNIDCKIPSVGQMGLKSEFVKKIMD